MRRIAILLTAMLLALATFGGPALAMEPAGEPAKKHFGAWTVKTPRSAGTLVPPG